ncbi:ATP-dependent DNA/RNA helicase DHX36-like [Paramacrobiotus metropolitanus]|uniref:ATP-dependent DNA/RNA helicase DHX36-like n=1 Tax=Paramacrobiotus metropolitanus TaxID=2943436 RepID=UPI002445931C|nr:ATP-dependent DNA/RNA helicase DHX36-like [Paramacrobiotus metropolitanus]
MASRKAKGPIDWEEYNDNDESDESESESDDEEDDFEEPDEEDIALMLKNYSLKNGLVEDLQTVAVPSTSHGSHGSHSSAGPSHGRAHASGALNLQPAKHLRGKALQEFLRTQSRLKKTLQKTPEEREKRKDRKERKRQEKAVKKDPKDYPSVYVKPSEQSALERLIADYRNSRNRAGNGHETSVPAAMPTASENSVTENTAGVTEADGSEMLDRGDHETEEWQEIVETDTASAPALNLDPGVQIRLDSLSLQFVDEFSQKRQKPLYKEMLAFRQKLPAWAARKDLLEMVNSSQVCVVSGETGCGKTTQLPQFILDDWIERGEGARCSIIVTQPRRISAISVSERIARERAEELGISVGYQIRLEKKLPRSHCSILMCTTGVLLQWLNSNRCLEGVSHVIVDEIHEQDILSDFLLIILKDLLNVRPDLRVILMSATINAEKFSWYFGGCPLMTIPGFTFPVREMFLEDILSVTHYKPRPPKTPSKKSFRDKEAGFEWEKYCTKLSLLDEAILIFLPGWDDIKKLNNLLSSGFRRDDINLIPLHSMMPTINQRQVFERSPNKRKIVIATSIAETSITIDDIVHVIDSGKIKMKDFDVKRNLSTLTAQWVSVSNARQRRGRAGRVKSGVCYYLYTSFQFSKLQMYPLPEMQRTRLDELCLQVKLLKLGLVAPFVEKAMEPPSPEAVDQAIGLLNMIGALDDKEELTPLGHLLARTPVPPQLGKMLYLGCIFKCIQPILNIVAMLSYRDPFCTPLGKENEARAQRLNFAVRSKSDHILCHDAIEDYMKATDRLQFCWDHYMSNNTCIQISKMKKQFVQILHSTGFLKTFDYMHGDANKNKDDVDLIKAVICGGLYPSLGVMGRSKGKLGANVQSENEKLAVHPKSYFGRGCTERGIVAFFTVVKTSQVFVHDITLMNNNLPVVLFCKSLRKFERDHVQCVAVDKWLNLKCPDKSYEIIKELRNVLEEMLSGIYIHGLAKSDTDDPEAEALFERIVKAMQFKYTSPS